MSRRSKDIAIMLFGIVAGGVIYSLFSPHGFETFLDRTYFMFGGVVIYEFIVLRRSKDLS